MSSLSVVPAVTDAPARSPQEKRLPRSRRRPPKFAWVLVAVLVVGTVLVLLWRQRPASQDGGTSFALGALMSSTADAARRLTTLVSEAAGAGRSVSGETTSSGPGEPAVARVSARGPSSSVSSPRPSTRPADQRAAGPSGLTGATPDAVPVLQPLVTLGDTPLAAGIGGNTLEDTPPAASIGDTSDVSHIYSAGDADVTPPVMRYPSLPRPLLAGVRSDPNTIELLVSAAGAVEQVRFVSAPKRMADMMLLSSAKTWRFEPASRDGTSVRYRLVVSWMTP